MSGRPTFQNISREIKLNDHSDRWLRFRLVGNQKSLSENEAVAYSANLSNEAQSHDRKRLRDYFRQPLLLQVGAPSSLIYSFPFFHYLPLSRISTEVFVCEFVEMMESESVIPGYSATRSSGVPHSELRWIKDQHAAQHPYQTESDTRTHSMQWGFERGAGHWVAPVHQKHFSNPSHTVQTFPQSTAQHTHTLHLNSKTVFVRQTSQKPDCVSEVFDIASARAFPRNHGNGC